MPTAIAIAIDFGTSRTKLAYLDETTGRPELMRLGQRDDPFIPSLFYLPRGREEVFLGDDAEEMLAQDPAGIVEVLKRKLHETHVRANRRRVTPQTLLARLFSDLRTRAARELPSFGGVPADVLQLTVPAIYGPAQERVLREATQQAGFTEVVLVPEPVAAARAWLAQASAEVPGIVVFDCGGGTVDWAYLRRDGADFHLVPECPPGGDQVGGYDLDRELLARVEDRLDDDALAALHGHEIEYLKMLRIVKERYCRGLPLLPLRIGDSQITLSAVDIEDAFEARFIRHASEGLKGYLTQVRAVAGADQPPVLLVGGSARIKGLREALEQTCDRETLWWERADYATVLGAVAGAVSGRATVAATTAVPNESVAQQIARAKEGYRYGDTIDLASYFQEVSNEEINDWHALALSGDASAQWLLGMYKVLAAEAYSCFSEYYDFRGELYQYDIAEEDWDENDRDFAWGREENDIKRLAKEGISWIRDAAEQGDATAQYSLGVLYDPEYAEGRQVFFICDCLDSDDAEALAWYRKAAEQGHPDAQCRLGFMYDEGQGDPRDDAEAMVWFRKAAEQGHSWAQWKLGLVYDNGEGVPQDHAEAVVWYRKAAEQGHSYAQYELGRMYHSDRGVPQDDAEAVVWYRKAAEQGDANAEYNLGLMYSRGEGVPQDDAEAIAWYRKAARRGHPDAQRERILYDQGQGVPQDDAEAMVWYRKAAEQGDSTAQYDLGNMYFGVQSYAEAAVWYRKAAEQGDSRAQYDLGRLYYYGHGVPQDDAEAVVWYHKAAEQGDPDARRQLDARRARGLMYDNRQGVLQDDAEAIARAWYCKAAELGKREDESLNTFLDDSGDDPFDDDPPF